MKPLNFNLHCPKCGNHFIAHFTELEADDTITCICGYDFPLNESQRADLARVLKERNDEIREIFAEVIRQKK